jgi:glycogen synthase
VLIIHISAECYPVAKAGGLGDVAGALPKYLVKEGHDAKMVMPMYRTRFLHTHEWEVVHKGFTNMGDHHYDYTIIRESKNVLGYELYLVDIYGLLDREKYMAMMMTRKDSWPFRLPLLIGYLAGIIVQILSMYMIIIRH